MTRTERPGSRVQSEDGQSSHMAASFTDLMASLMVIFILLFVATLSNKAKAEKTGRETTIEFLLGALKSALAKGGLESGGIQMDDRDPYAVVIVMPEDLLFASGVSLVAEQGQAYLNRMVPLLAGIVCRSDVTSKVASVVVEGHTDSVWRGPTLPGADGPQMNLELSQRRSMDVVRWSLASLGEGRERDCFRGLLSASGRGQEELLDDLAGDHPRQRRVVFKIRTQQDALASVAGRLATATQD